MHNEIDEFNSKVEILPGETTTYYNYIYYEVIIRYKAHKDWYVGFEIHRSFAMPGAHYGFYMIIEGDSIPILLSSETVDKFMVCPYEAEKMALDFKKRRSQWGDAR